MTDQGEQVDVVYLDVSKAFDSVCHRLLKQESGSDGDPSYVKALGRRISKQQNFQSKIGRSPFKYSYLKKWDAHGFCAWTPSLPLPFSCYSSMKWQMK